MSHVWNTDWGCQFFKDLLIISYIVDLQPDELTKTLEMARDMSRQYGHMFDKVIINQDLDLAYQDILQICDDLEMKPQYVPSSWVH